MSEERSEYTVERIGECDWCGLVSHHLLEGECPACRRRVRGEGDEAVGPVALDGARRCGREGAA